MSDASAVPPGHPTPLELDFRFVREAEPGPAWEALFREFWPAFRRWYYAPSPGAGTRPDYATCRRMLRAHLPMLVPLHERLTDLIGGGDDVARFLTLYTPPPSIRGCSQAVWRHDGDIALVRNYDFAPRLCDGVVLRSAWSGRATIALTDCLVGALDGMNEDGLAAALAFGGRRKMAPGFGTTIVLRAVLESCSTVDEAVRLVRDVPVHMAYSMTLVDARDNFATVHLGPGRPAEVSAHSVVTNHQETVTWPEHARFSQTVERRRRAEALLAQPPVDALRLAEQFLEPPLYRRAYARGSGTLYTAVYAPRAGTLDLLWPDARRQVDFERFPEDVHLARYAVDPAAPHEPPDAPAVGTARDGPD